MNKKKIGLTGLGIILLIVGILFLLKNKEKSFNPIKIEKTSYIKNWTDKPYLDTIVYIGLTELDIRGVSVQIKILSDDIEVEDMELLGFIQGNIGNQYIIFIKDTGRLESIDIISHELIHLNQMYDSRLINGSIELIWENQIFNKDDIMEYNLRPWEIEAKYLGLELSYKLKQKLY